MGRLIALALCVLAGPLAGLAPARAGDCPEGPESVLVAEITGRLEILLADGRLIRLAGLEPPPPELDPRLLATMRARLAEWLEGGEARLAAQGGKPDRWGRIAGRLSAFSPEAGAATDAATFVVAAGAARRADPDEAGPCRAALRAAETQARAAGRGLWAEPSLAPLAASDRALLASRAGRFVVVEGRIRRVGTGRKLVFLDFGPSREDFTATLSERVRKALQAQGVEPTRLAGRLVRLRGIVDLRGERPTIDIPSASALDVIDQQGSSAR